MDVLRLISAAHPADPQVTYPFSTNLLIFWASSLTGLPQTAQGCTLQSSQYLELAPPSNSLPHRAHVFLTDLYGFDASLSAFGRIALVWAPQQHTNPSLLSFALA